MIERTLQVYTSNLSSIELTIVISTLLIIFSAWLKSRMERKRRVINWYDSVIISAKRLGPWIDSYSKDDNSGKIRRVKSRGISDNINKLLIDAPSEVDEEVKRQIDKLSTVCELLSSINESCNSSKNDKEESSKNNKEEIAKCIVSGTQYRNAIRKAENAKNDIPVFLWYIPFYTRYKK